MKKSLLKLAFAAVIAVLAVPFAGSRAVAQTRNLTGTVVDKQGNPVIGAAVVVEGTTKGTSTGVDGSFSLDGVKENASLTVSFIGYKTLTTPPWGENIHHDHAGRGYAAARRCGGDRLRRAA